MNKAQPLLSCLILIFAAGCRADLPKATETPTQTSIPTAIPSPTPSRTASPTPAPPASPTAQAGDSRRIIKVNNLERTYLLHIPPGRSLDHSIPLLMVFHGYTDNPENLQRETGYNDIADKGGFLVVYPVGSGPGDALSWNAGSCCGSAQADNIDEAAFIRKMIADLYTIAAIDAKRIYAAGISNGGFLAYRLACEMSDIFAGVAPVAGALLTSPCEPAQPVSVIAIHGLIDETVPYAGGLLIDQVPIPPVEQTIATWANLDGCRLPPKIKKTGIFSSTAYDTCRNGSSVELYAIKYLGHWWPGNQLEGVTVSQIIWDFFAAHPKP